MKKLSVMILPVILCFFLMSEEVHAAEEMEKYWKEKYLSEIEQSFEDLYPDMEINVDGLWELILSGNITGALRLLLENLLEIAKTEYGSMKKLMLSILLLGILSAVLQVLTDILGDGKIAVFSQYLLFLLMVTVLGRAFYSLYTMTEELLKEIVLFVRLILPAYTATLMLSGNLSVAVMWKQLILFLAGILEKILQALVLPGIGCYFLFSLFDGIWEKERCKALVEGLQKGIEAILKYFMIFTVSISILQTMITPVITSVQWGIVKKVAALIPGIGALSAGAAELYAGSVLALRSVVGVFFTFLLLGISMLPLIRIFCVSLCIRLGSMLSSLFAPGTMSLCTERASIAGFLLFKLLFSCMAFFFLTLALSVTR